MPEAQLSLGVSTDPAAEMDARILRLLYPGAGERVAINDEERRLLHILRGHCGLANAVWITELAKQLDISSRAVKAATRGLILKCGLKIVGSRQPPYGYFVALTREELQHGRNTLRAEIAALVERLIALDDNEEALVMVVRRACAGEKPEGEAA